MQSADARFPSGEGNKAAALEANHSLVSVALLDVGQSRQKLQQLYGLRPNIRVLTQLGRIRRRRRLLKFKLPVFPFLVYIVIRFYF